MTVDGTGRGSSASSGACDAEFQWQYGVLIHRVGVDLRIGPVAIATGSKFFQEFFITNDPQAFDPKKVATACLWLATKVVEDPRRLRDVMNSFLFLEGKSSTAEEMVMEDYWKHRDELVAYEQCILRALQFDLVPASAHMFLLEYAWLVQCRPGDSGVLALAWAMMNNAYCSRLCCKEEPQRLGFACLLLAARMGCRVPAMAEEANEVSSVAESLLQEANLADWLQEPRKVGQNPYARSETAQEGNGNQSTKNISEKVDLVQDLQRIAGDILRLFESGVGINSSQVLGD